MPEPTSGAAVAAPTVQDQAGKLLTRAAGYADHRAIEMGIRHGIFETLAEHPSGLTPAELAKAAGLDPFYTEVWCRAAYGAEVLDTSGGDRYRLASHMDTLLLDRDSPAFTGGLFTIFEQREIFDLFSEKFASGERIWWDQCSPEWIRAVANTGGAFNNRFIPGAVSKVPGLEARLKEGVHVLELACGVGLALVKLKRAFPKCKVTGLDGDAFSLKLASETLARAGLDKAVDLVESTLEDLDAEEGYDVVTINVSMHESRDIDKVTKNVHRALKTGGRFVISDFAFPEDRTGLRTAPGRIQAGIQFFEALIGDQLLPTKAYVALLKKHGFKDVGFIDVNPVHALTYGTK